MFSREQQSGAEMSMASLAGDKSMLTDNIAKGVHQVEIVRQISTRFEEISRTT